MVEGKILLTFMAINAMNREAKNYEVLKDLATESTENTEKGFEKRREIGLKF